MAIGVFPVAKLGGLVLKQISKPIAETIKNSAKNSPIFRAYIIIPPARMYNWCERKLKMWLLHFGQPVNIAVLSEEMAVELGANLLGEFIVFSIGAGVLLNEYVKSVKKEQAKESKLRAELSELNTSITELYLQLEEQRTIIRSLSRQVAHLTPVPKSSDKPDDKHKDDGDDKKPPSQPPHIHNMDKHKTSQNTTNKNQNSSVKLEHRPTNVLVNAFKNLEETFRDDKNWKEEDSILIDALNFLSKDVYNVRMRF